MGIPIDWEEDRKILHYSSEDLWIWTYEGELDLKSNRVIDACIYKINEDTYKMWYKDEANHSYTTAASSKDLYHFEVLGVEIDDCPQEGPNVFELGGKKWMISDCWDGLAVYSSDDYINWKRCKNILKESGTRMLDQGVGHHADVVVVNERAYIFYFCHPFHTSHVGERNFGNPNSAFLQVAELKIENNILVCNRNEEIELVL